MALTKCILHDTPCYYESEETGGFCPRCGQLGAVIEKAPDMVNQPPHYMAKGVECIDAMTAVFGQEAVQSYCRINAFKYLWRHRMKGKQTEDLDKAIWYLRFSQGDDPRTK